MYSVYDSVGKLVRTGFPTYIAALMYAQTFGNRGWRISKY